jgi:hypothetical protein
MSFPSSSVALPVECDFSIPPSIPPEARTYTSSQSPNGVTSVSGVALPTTVFTAGSAGTLANVQFSAQQLTFDIPCGQSNSTFLDCASTTLSFTLQWVVTTASVTSVQPCYINLISSASSFIDTLQVYANNVPIESISNYGQLQNMALSCLANSAERSGSLTFMGCDYYQSSGINLAHATVGTYRYNFSIPLMSIIGMNNVGGRYLPVGMLNNMQLFIQSASLLPIVAYATTGATVTTQPVITAPSLDSWFLNTKLIDMGASAVPLIMNSLKNGKIYIKSSTWLNSNIAIPVGTSGVGTYLLQLRASSVKSLFWYSAQGATTATPNGTYDAVNIGCNLKEQVIIGGGFYPNKELNPSQQPSLVMASLAQAWGYGTSYNFGGIINSYQFNSTLPSVSAGSDAQLVIPAVAGTRPVPVGSDYTAQALVNYLSCAFRGVDLEKAGKSTLYQGVNTRNTPPYISQNYSVATTVAGTIISFALCDLILEIDPLSKSIVGYV